MKKHFMLSTISTLAFATTSGIHTFGLLPDTTTPFHLIVETGIAKTLDLLPVKTPKKFKTATLTNIVDSTQAAGIKFIATPDLKQLLDAALVGKLKSAASSDTVVYLGTMPALTGDEDIGDNELVVLSIGPQAKQLIDTFTDLGEYKAMESMVVKQFFTALVTPKHIETKSGKSVGQPLKQMAEA